MWITAAVYSPAKVVDVIIDNVGDPAQFGFRPDVVSDAFPDECPVLVAHEEFKEGEFLCRESEFLAVAEGPALHLRKSLRTGYPLRSSGKDSITLLL